MKKLLVLLLCVPLMFSCGENDKDKKEQEQKITIDDFRNVNKDGIKNEVNKQINEDEDLEGVVLVRNMYEQDETTIVLEYDIYQDIFTGVSDRDLKERIKAATDPSTKSGIKASGLNVIYKYYIDDKVVKEVMITEEEW